MDMTGERRIPAPRQTVWEALNDPEMLRACIPGCESLERTGPDQMKATAAVKIGPIAARFTGIVTLSDIDPPNSYRISGEGNGGVAGFAKGGAQVRLADEGADTLLTYTVSAQVGGKIAQLGARLIDATSKQMADLFFNRFAAAVATPAAPAPAPIIPPMKEPDMLLETTPVRLTPGAAGAPAAPVPLWALVPAEMFGLPIAACIGIVLWVLIMILIFKSVVFG